MTRPPRNRIGKKLAELIASIGDHPPCVCHCIKADLQSHAQIESENGLVFAEYAEIQGHPGSPDLVLQVLKRPQALTAWSWFVPGCALQPRPLGVMGYFIRSEVRVPLRLNIQPAGQERRGKPVKLPDHLPRRSHRCRQAKIHPGGEGNEDEPCDEDRARRGTE
jgi:hypothetical protein